MLSKTAPANLFWLWGMDYISYCMNIIIIDFWIPQGLEEGLVQILMLVEQWGVTQQMMGWGFPVAAFQTGFSLEG